MTAPRLEAEGPGRFRLSGPVDFGSVGNLLAAGEMLFSGPAASLDLGGVTHVDSAALALLLEWLRRARNHRRDLRYTGIPDKLRAIARLSGVEDIIAG